MIADDVLAQAAALLYDEAHVRYPAANLLRHFNEAQWDLTNLAPELLGRPVVVKLDEGDQQTLPAESAKFLGMPRNMVAPMVISIAAADAVKAEGNSGTTNLTFTVTRELRNNDGVSSANYAVTGSSGDSANAADFTGAALPAGTIAFAAGETAKTLTVPVQGDATVETDEGFTVTLSNPVNAVLGTATATGTIQNDDIASPLNFYVLGADAGGHMQIAASTDYGASYTYTGLGFDEANWGQLSDLYAWGNRVCLLVQKGDYTGFDIYVSTNYGATFTLLTPGPSVPNPAPQVFAYGCYQGRIVVFDDFWRPWTTTDFVTWTQGNALPLDGGTITQLKYVFYGDGAWWILGNGTGFSPVGADMVAWYSTDNGLNWTLDTNGFNTLSKNIGLSQGTSAWTGAGNDNGLVIMAEASFSTNVRLLRTGGAWSYVSPNTLNFWPVALSNGKYVTILWNYSGNVGRTYVSADNGQTFVQAGADHAIKSVALSVYNGHLICQNNNDSDSAYVSTDDGASWVRAGNPAFPAVYSFSRTS
jgi:hypothetical protein